MMMPMREIEKIDWSVAKGAELTMYVVDPFHPRPKFWT